MIAQSHSDTVDTGMVISQNPAAGTQVHAGDTVNVTISQGPDPDELKPLPKPFQSLIRRRHLQAHPATAEAVVAVLAAADQCQTGFRCSSAIRHITLIRLTRRLILPRIIRSPLPCKSTRRIPVVIELFGMVPLSHRRTILPNE